MNNLWDGQFYRHFRFQGRQWHLHRNGNNALIARLENYPNNHLRLTWRNVNGRIRVFGERPLTQGHNAIAQQAHIGAYNDWRFINGLETMLENILRANNHMGGQIPYMHGFFAHR